MKSKKEDVRPITDKQLRYLKRLVRNSDKKIRAEDIEGCNSLKDKIEGIGIENLTLELAREYIANFVEFERAYQQQYESEARKIDNTIKIIDFSKYRKM